MGIEKKHNLITQLVQFQSDYYTRGKAHEAYTLLTSNSSILRFKDKTVSERFEKYCDNLKNCESINDLDNYATIFAKNLIQIIIILKQML